jgi:hypothetical protein
MTEEGIEAYNVLHKTWNEMATAVETIITPKANPIVNEADAAQ